MIWLIIYLIGALIIYTILANQEGEKEVLDIVTHIILACSWVVLLIAFWVFKIYLFYSKTKKNYDKERTA